MNLSLVNLHNFFAVGLMLLLFVLLMNLLLRKMNLPQYQARLALPTASPSTN